MTNLSIEIRFLLKHSSIYGLSNVLSKAVAFVLLPLYTRFLTARDYGILELIDVTTGMVGMVIGVGITAAMSRFYYDFEAETDRHRVVSTVYFIVCSISGLSLFFASIFAGPVAGVILDSPSYKNYFIISFATLMFGILIDIGQTYLRLLYKSFLFMSISIASLIVGISLNILLIVYMRWGVQGVLYSGLITKLLVVIPMTAVILYKVGFGFKWTLAKEMLRFSLPLIPSSLAMTAVNYSDRYFIKHYVSIADAGIYGLANKLGTAIHMLITSPFIMTFLPRRFQIVNQANARQIFSKVYDYYCLVTIFIGLMFSVFIDEIMYLMTTPGFYQAAEYVPLIVLTMFVLGMKYHFEFGVLYEKKTEFYSYINMFTACIHLILNFLLVGSYGLWGAVGASLIAISLNTSLIYLVGNRLYRIDFEFFRNAKMFAIALALYFLSKVSVSDGNLVQVGYKLLMVSIFPFCLIWLKILSKSEITKVKEVASNIFRGAKYL